MVRAAIADQPGFAVDDREMRRDGPSYTVHDAARAARRGPGAAAVPDHRHGRVPRPAAVARVARGARAGARRRRAPPRLVRAARRPARRAARGARHAAGRGPARPPGGPHPRAAGHAARDFLDRPARPDRRRPRSRVTWCPTRCGPSSATPVVTTPEPRGEHDSEATQPHDVATRSNARAKTRDQDRGQGQGRRPRPRQAEAEPARRRQAAARRAASGDGAGRAAPQGRAAEGQARRCATSCSVRSRS